MFTDPEFWVLVAFVLFFVLFGRRLWTALAGMLDQRAARVRAALDEARSLREQAERMLEEARASRAGAEAEARDMLARSRAEAARLAEETAAAAAEAAKRRERQALDRIAAAEKAVILDLRRDAAALATEAAGLVIAETTPPEVAQGWIDHAINDLNRALRAA